jgi:hypothetical protein
MRRVLVGGDPPPDDRALQDRLQQSQALADRRLTDTRRAKVGLVALDYLRRDRAKLAATEMGQDVPVPHFGVHMKRPRRKLGFRVHPPPLLSEVRDRLTSGVQQIEFAQPASASQVGVERIGVALPVESARAVPIGVAPANHPYVASPRPRLAVDAHRIAPSLICGSNARSPFTAG